MFKSFFQTGIRAIYNVSENPTFVSEPWSIYPAKHKQSGRIVSVFIFDKTKFESQIHKLCSNSSGSKSPKVIISECYELIKNELAQLSKIKHPQILTIYEVLEDTKTKFLFVSEPVVDNLQTVDIKKNLDQLSIQKGLLQISKGTQFLHNKCSTIHFNLQPSSIFINNQGDWKLAGFKFLQNLNEIPPGERDNFYIMNNSSIVPFANLNLNFTAPELLVDSQSKLDYANDIWAIGNLIYYLYNGGDCLINCFDHDSISDFKAEFRKFEAKFYNHRPSELKYLLKEIPEKLYPIYPRLLARYPHDRATIDEFIDSDFFNGSVIKAMWFIDEFPTKTVDERFIFLQGLPEVDPVTGKSLLSEFPASFRSGKMLPLLLDLIQSELNVAAEHTIDENIDQLLNYALDIVFKIGADLSSLTFQDRIYEVILKKSTKKKSTDTFTKLIHASTKTRLTIIRNLTTLNKKLSDAQIVSVIKSLDELILIVTPPVHSTELKEQIELQESFLAQLGTVVAKIEFPYIKNTLFPLLCQVFKSTTILSTKLITIQAFEMFVDEKIIDKVIVTEQLFPVLKGLKSRDKRVVGKMLNFFVKLCSSEHVKLGLESIIDSVLPQCYSLVFGCNDCTQNEFKQFMVKIDNLQKVLVEKKLSTLSDKPIQHGADEPRNFSSLINTQTLNDGNKESQIQAPRTKNVMQPTRKPSGPTNGATGAGPHPKKATPLTLKPKKSTQDRTQLSFGATNHTTNTTNTKLLNSLNATKVEDDDFEDFQSWGESGSNATSIDWTAGRTPTAAPSTPVLGQTGTTSARSFTTPVASNSSPVGATAKVSTPTQYPPGFNASILSPSTRSPPSKTKSPPQNSNTDLLDFL